VAVDAAGNVYIADTLNQRSGKSPSRTASSPRSREQAWPDSRETAVPRFLRSSTTRSASRSTPPVRSTLRTSRTTAFANSHRAAPPIPSPPTRECAGRRQFRRGPAQGGDVGAPSGTCSALPSTRRTISTSPIPATTAFGR
jgi:hypothetical protein